MNRLLRTVVFILISLALPINAQASLLQGAGGPDGVPVQEHASHHANHSDHDARAMTDCKTEKGFCQHIDKTCKNPLKCKSSNTSQATAEKNLVITRSADVVADLACGALLSSSELIWHPPRA
jgi:hypothetical protein